MAGFCNFFRQLLDVVNKSEKWLEQTVNLLCVHSGTSARTFLLAEQIQRLNWPL